MTDIFDTIKQSTELDIFATTLQVAKLDRMLRIGKFTVFAPIDLAFTSLSKTTLQKLSADTSLLTEILRIHIVNGCLQHDELLSKSKSGDIKLQCISLDGSLHQIDLSDGMKIGTARILSIDSSPSNGIIYNIDRFLSNPIFAQLLLPECEYN